VISRIIDAKRQEKVILGVYDGLADAGFVREAALQGMKEREFDMKKHSHPCDDKSRSRTGPIAWTKKKGNQTLALEVRQLLLDSMTKTS